MLTASKPTSRNQNYVLIPLEEEIDESNLHEFDAKIQPLIESNHRYIVFDFGNIQIINSKVIGYLANTHGKLSKLDKRMVFVNTNEEILEILDLVGFNQLVESFREEAHFCDALRRGEI